jgi:hypothetical protein
LTFSAPPFFYTANIPLFAYSYTPVQSAAATSSSGNYLLTAEELSQNSVIGVMKMPASSSSSDNFPSPFDPNPVYIDLSATSNSECASSGTTYSFDTKGDPHGVGLFTGLNSEIGILIDYYDECAALIDLKGLYEAQRSSSNSAQVNSSVDLRATQIVRFVKL